MIKIVTGFVSLKNSPKTIERYAALGTELMKVGHPIHAVLNQDIEDCWLYKWLEWNRLQPTHSVADNALKNTVGYHIIQHQKTIWMVSAAFADPVPDVFAWIDFGIFSVPGITVAVIHDFLRKAANEKAIVMPGCWQAHSPIDDANPCWRFCGGMFVCPRSLLLEMDTTMRLNTMRHIQATKNVSWEVNTWARVEQDGRLPIHWYQADHNQTMFTNYPEPARGTH